MHVPRFSGQLRSINCIAFVLLTGVTLSCATATATAQVLPAGAARAQPLVAMVRGDVGAAKAASYGAGIVFARTDDRLLIATAYHILFPHERQVSRVTVALNRDPSQWFEATISSHVDKRSDLAVIEVTLPKPMMASFAFDMLPPGDPDKLGPDVYAIGFGNEVPWITILQPFLISRQENNRWLWVQTELITNGYSGGALVDKNGNLVGMVESHRDAEARILRYDALLAILAQWNYPVSLREHGAPNKSPVPSDLTNERQPALVALFRHSLFTISGDIAYVGDIHDKSIGLTYAVMTGADGQVTRVTRARNGQTQAETSYHYSSGSTRADAGESFVDGKKGTTVRIQRDSRGYRTRDDYFNADGSLQRYLLYKYTSREVEIIETYTDGREPARRLREFSLSGIMTLERQFTPDAASEYQYRYDDKTGVLVSRTKISNGRLAITYKVTYDDRGDLLEENLYTPENTWYGVVRFSDGLAVKKYYRFLNGQIKESDITYDARRRPSEAKIFINGNFICTLRAEWNQSDGFIGTVALGPHGEKWAEYPNNWVNDVVADGHALDGYRSVVYRSGSWW
jgi:hypothetical protein